MIKIQENLDCIDLNIGPAKRQLDKIYNWLGPIAENKNLSFDSTNTEAIEQGLKLVKNPQNCFINSTSKDAEKLDKLSDLAIQYNCNLIALAMSKETGIPKTADGRLEIIFEIYEKCIDKGLDTQKIFFDPLVLPICADQTQAIETINTIRMIKESFEPEVKTIIGLSNISNGCNSKLRPLINRVFGALAFGSGLDAVILDAKDYELIRIFRMLESQNPTNQIDKLYLNLANIIKNFEELENIPYNKDCIDECEIIKTAEILLNKKVYSDNFTQV